MIHFIYCAFSCINLNFYYLRILFLCPSTIFYLFNYYYNYFILQLLVHKSRLFELHINLNAFFLVFICFLFHELSLSLFSFFFFTIKLNVMSFYLFMGLMPSNEFLLSARTALWRTAWFPSGPWTYLPSVGAPLCVNSRSGECLSVCLSVFRAVSARYREADWPTGLLCTRGSGEYTFKASLRFLF